MPRFFGFFERVSLDFVLKYHTYNPVASGLEVSKICSQVLPNAGRLVAGMGILMGIQIGILMSHADMGT